MKLLMMMMQAGSAKEVSVSEKKWRLGCHELGLNLKVTWMSPMPSFSQSLLVATKAFNVVVMDETHKATQ